jgi:hypothetical protein
VDKSNSGGPGGVEIPHGSRAEVVVLPSLTNVLGGIGRLVG